MPALLMFATTLLLAQSAPSIRLATIDPGEVYWQRFGHNTLIVTRDDRQDEALSFNFGFFDFEQPNFLTRFLLGRMLYQALALPVRDDLGGYVDERRSVHVQSLALAPDQARRLSEALVDAVQPENRDYLYEYFRANCSTRIRDVIDAAMGGELKRQTIGRSRGSTYRMHAARLAQGDFWLATGIDLGLGPDTDRPLTFWDEMFIPELMRRNLREVTMTDGTRLVAGEDTWFDSGQAPPPELARDRKLAFALTGVLIATLLLWLQRRARNRVGASRALSAIAAALHLVFGLAGAVLLFLWLGTDHIAAHRNENLLLLSPLSLFLVPGWIGYVAGRRTVSVFGNTVAALVAASALLALAVKTLPDTFIQSNLHWCLLLVPIHLALLIAWRGRLAPTDAIGAIEIP